MSTVILVITWAIAAVVVSTVISKRRFDKLEDRIKKLEGE